MGRAFALSAVTASAVRTFGFPRSSAAARTMPTGRTRCFCVTRFVEGFECIRAASASAPVPRTRPPVFTALMKSIFYDQGVFVSGGIRCGCSAAVPALLPEAVRCIPGRDDLFPSFAGNAPGYQGNAKRKKPITFLMFWFDRFKCKGGNRLKQENQPVKKASGGGVKPLPIVIAVIAVIALAVLVVVLVRGHKPADTLTPLQSAEPIPVSADAKLSTPVGELVLPQELAAVCRIEDVSADGQYAVRVSAPVGTDDVLLFVLSVGENGSGYALAVHRMHPVRRRLSGWISTRSRKTLRGRRTNTLISMHCRVSSMISSSRSTIWKAFREVRDDYPKVKAQTRCFAVSYGCEALTAFL